MLACDLALYVVAVAPGLETTAIWTVRGYVVALAMPMIAFAIARGGYRHFTFEVSRDAAFVSASALAITGYVLLMAIAGYLLRRVLGPWGPAAQGSLFIVAGGLLVMTYASKSLRRRWSVFLAKHFFQHKYNYRREWLRFIATLSDSGAGEDPRVTALRAVAQIVASPSAILLMNGEDRTGGRPAAVWPPDDVMLAAAADIRISAPLVELLEQREWVFDVAEQAGERPRAHWLDLPGSLPGSLDWRLVVPVMLKDRLLGMILLAEPPQPFTLTFEDRDLLKTVARHVATHLAQVEAEQRLAEARQFQAYSRLAAFTAHDLKNAAAQLQMLVDNAARHKDNPAFIDDAVDTVANASARISRLIEHLARGTAPGSSACASVEQAVDAAVERSRQREPRPRLVVEARGLVVGAATELLTSIVEHLIRNAQDATPPDGNVSVVVRRRGSSAIIEVGDSGVGMTRAFIQDRLFRPFDTTKGTKGMGIGAYQARELVRGMGGDLDVESVPGRGTTVCVVLPLAGEVSAA
jgi:putative PEP-CTERM system histidine kinase